MKQLLFLILVLFVSCSIAIGQSRDKILIPILKENPKVDKLMDFILTHPNDNATSTSASTCYMIDLLKTGDQHFSLQIEKDTKSIIDTLVNGISIDKDLFGCFLYKKQIVFVWADKSFASLFIKTSEKRTFDFLHKFSDVQPPSSDYFIDIWHYQYENGQFSVEGPPPVAN